jgi:hypothetical protein
LANKVNYFSEIKKNGLPVNSAVSVISWVADHLSDDLSLSQQYFIVPGNTTEREFKLNFRDEAEFTYFYEEGADIESEVKIKLNGMSTEFSIAPDFYTEELMNNIRVSNTSATDKLIYVYQLFAQGVNL